MAVGSTLPHAAAHHPLGYSSIPVRLFSWGWRMPQCRQRREGACLPILVAPLVSRISFIQGCPGPASSSRFSVLPESMEVPVLAAQAHPRLPLGSRVPSPGRAQQDSSRISLLSWREATTAHAPAFDVCLICRRLIKA